MLLNYAPKNGKLHFMTKANFLNNCSAVSEPSQILNSSIKGLVDPFGK